VGTAAADIGHTISTYVRVVPQSFGNLYDDVVHPSANHTQAGSERTMSIIGIGRTATQAEQSGLYTLIWFFVLINIAFAIINMLPMLPLDGGHVAIAVYERIRTPRGKPYYQADAAKLMPVAYGFMALLLVVVVASAYLDIAHPVANPFR
jgi:membrane-associated protease RseP (regulator of RpoE activity)